MEADTRIEVPDRYSWYVIWVMYFIWSSIFLEMWAFHAGFRIASEPQHRDPGHLLETTDIRHNTLKLVFRTTGWYFVVMWASKHPTKSECKLFSGLHFGFCEAYPTICEDMRPRELGGSLRKKLSGRWSHWKHFLEIRCWRWRPPLSETWGIIRIGSF